jgi:hypothetical protein
MTDTPDPPSDDVEPDQDAPAPSGASSSPDEAIRALGYDPAAVRALVVTATSVVAIAADYPDPTDPDTGQEPTPGPVEPEPQEAP